MDESSIPSTAIYGGSLAHTFEYHTTGVHAMPHLHWSFPLQEGATISCPVLVAENVVYVGDSAGFLSALDARSGNLLWCFATDWALDGGKPVGADAFTGVTAFCLAGKLGYVASAHQTLYEVDLSNGQALRSWDNEALEIPFGDITSLLFYDRFILFNDLEGSREGVFSCLDPATGSIYPSLFPFGNAIIYRHPGDGFDVIYGYELIDNAPPLPMYAVFRAIDLSPEDTQEDSTLWYMRKREAEVHNKVYEGLYTVMDEVREDLYTVMDKTVYVVCDLLLFLGGSAEAVPMIDDYGVSMSTELLALDPFTGAEQWRYTLPVGEDPFQVAAASHLIFLVTRYGVEAIDTHTHQPRWEWTSNRDNRHVLVADGLLFVLDETGQITALDALTGEPRWSLQVEQPIKGQLSTIADATLYIVMDHILCAFR